MKTYRLRVPHSVAELIRNMHPQLKRKIRFSLDTILGRPEEGKDLRSELSGLRSFKVGRSRIVYRVQHDTVEIVAIGPRSMIYRETLQLLKKESKTGG